jgi:hypothetical protein
MHLYIPAAGTADVFPLLRQIGIQRREAEDQA